LYLLFGFLGNYTSSFCLNLLGRFFVGNVQRQSDPLALTQLINLYHVMSARKRMQRGEYLVKPQLR
jgi:hypothetical protein